MLLDFDLNVPAATPESSPVVADCQLTHGVLKQVRVYFPPGCATLVHVVVKDTLHQLVPANTDGDLNFDEALITASLDHELKTSPHKLQVYGWSPAAIYNHNITIQFELDPVKGMTQDEMMLKLLEEINAEPEA